MRAQRKLRVVTRHEFLTIVKQPSFWISLIAAPLIILIIFLIGYFTDQSDDTQVEPGKHKLSVMMIDNSNLIEPAIASAFGIKTAPASSEDKLVRQVKDGSLDGLIIYPSDIEQSGSYRVLADNTKKDNGSTIGAIAKTTLQQSLLAPLGSEELAALTLSGGEAKVDTFKNGEPARDFADYIVPGSFLIVFYIILIFSISYALTSVSEEKENRSIEMVLSYLNPQTLILGKLLGIVLVTLTQILFLAAIALVAYLVARALGNDLSLPFSFSDITFEPVSILFGAAFLVIGFIFYVSAMATIGAIFPSAKEASGFSTVFFILPAVPFWGFEALTAETPSTFAQIVTYFPLTSPTASMMRNTVGNLGVAEGLIALVLLLASTIFMVFIASKAFRLGMLEYNSRVKFTALFKRS